MDNTIPEEIHLVCSRRRVRDRIDIRIWIGALAVIEASFDRRRNNSVEPIRHCGNHLPVYVRPISCAINHCLEGCLIPGAGYSGLREARLLIETAKRSRRGQSEQHKAAHLVVQPGCESLI